MVGQLWDEKGCLMAVSYTFSKLDCFNTCPYQFRSRYIVFDPRLPDTEAQIKGNRQHKAFEDTFSGKIEPPGFVAPYMNAVERLGEGRIIVSEIELAIDRRGEKCHYKAPEVYLRGKFDLMAIPADAEELKGLKLQSRYGFPAQVDSSRTAFSIDWKTGKPGYAKPFQLDIGALLLFAHVPKLKRVAARLVYTSFTEFWPPNPGEWHVVDSSTVGEVRREVDRQVAEVEKAVRTGNYPKKPSGLCGFCPSVDCEHRR